MSIGKVEKHYRAGIVGCKISIHDIDADGEIDWEAYPAWPAKVPKRPIDYTLRVFCWQARDLPIADESGKSDPFISISDCEGVKNSSVVYDSVNPIFFECLECSYEANKGESKEDISLTEFPPIICELFDQDEGITGHTFDYLARATIRLADEDNAAHLSFDDTIRTPKWYPVYFKKGGP